MEGVGKEPPPQSPLQGLQAQILPECLEKLRVKILISLEKYSRAFGTKIHFHFFVLILSIMNWWPYKSKLTYINISPHEATDHHPCRLFIWIHVYIFCNSPQGLYLNLSNNLFSDYFWSNSNFLRDGFEIVPQKKLQNLVKAVFNQLKISNHR